MTIELSAFRWVPPFAQGYVKDLPVRWALEEAGRAYTAVLVDGQVTASADYRQWQPFGQVPAYRDGEVALFETGAILLHIAATSDVLSPKDTAGRARVAAWVIAALNSIEPYVHAWLDLEDDPDSSPRRLQAEETLKARLAALAAWLGGKVYLEGVFTAGDVMMTTALRELVNSGLLAQFPSLDAYRQRCEARPAFGRAMAAQMQVFADNAPR